jgi:tetratricopeptide (TPR) repeat protein
MFFSMKKILPLAIFIMAIQGCHQWDNFITYFNTYYNMERLLDESREEFEYQEEKKRIFPKVLVPDTKFKMPEPRETGIPPFLTEFIVNKRTRQPIAVKLDSIIIKGSKILSKHPKSDYIQGTLYLMALSYFYQNLWLNTQIKCGELIDRFPDGKLSPDAHLLLAESLLIQRKFEAGKIVLSRTVDIAWQLERYDILSEAFRIQAELALFQKDYDEALKPYKQAIIQSDNDKMRAKWQFDLAALVFRIGKFETAERLFRKVHEFAPDYITQFEAFLYQASSLARIGKFEEAEKILEKLETDGKFEEWKSAVYAQRMNIYRLKNMDEDFAKSEAYADTALVGNDAVAALYYEKGLDLYEQHDYSGARIYFGKSRSVANPVSKKASEIYKLLDKWNSKRANIIPKMQKINSKRELTEDEKSELAFDMYEMGRVQEQLGNLDSADYYYLSSTTLTIPEDERSARYLYTYARFLEETKPLMSDSLMELIVQRYPLTEYGQDAIERLGYTDEFVIDTVRELYQSGVRLWKNKEYDFAIIQFSKLFNFYPKSDLAPKSIYTIGWIFENDIGSFDKALEYYKMILEHYPNSIYAHDVRRTVDYTTIVENDGELPDSLKDKKLDLYIPKVSYLQMLETDEIQEQMQKKKKRPKSIETEDILSNPTKIFKDLWESLPDKDELLDEPKKMLETITNPDSLKNMAPGLNIPDPFKDIKKGDKKPREENKEEQEKEGEKKEPAKQEEENK